MPSMTPLAENSGTAIHPLLERRKILQGRAGVFGIGLAAYWPQFPGLKERLEGYQREVEARRASST